MGGSRSREIAFEAAKVGFWKGYTAQSLSGFGPLPVPQLGLSAEAGPETFPGDTRPGHPGGHGPRCACGDGGGPGTSGRSGDREIGRSGILARSRGSEGPHGPRRGRTCTADKRREVAGVAVAGDLAVRGPGTPGGNTSLPPGPKDTITRTRGQNPSRASCTMKAQLQHKTPIFGRTGALSVWEKSSA